MVCFWSRKSYNLPHPRLLKFNTYCCDENEKQTSDRYWRNTRVFVITGDKVMLRLCSQPLPVIQSKRYLEGKTCTFPTQFQVDYRFLIQKSKKGVWSEKTTSPLQGYLDPSTIGISVLSVLVKYIKCVHVAYMYSTYTHKYTYAIHTHIAYMQKHV